MIRLQKGGHLADDELVIAIVAKQSRDGPPRGRLLGREAVGEFPGSDDFLYINDKKSILRWAISVSGAPLRPPAALL